MFLGLRTAIYSVTDLDAVKRWYSDILGKSPYFDEPFYVGFEVGGYELGLIPDGKGTGRGSLTVYWGVPDAREAQNRLLEKGARIDEEVQDVGGGIKIGSVIDPFGNVFGVIENPHFKAD